MNGNALSLPPTGSSRFALGRAVAVAAALAALLPAAAIPPVNLSDVAAGQGGFVASGVAFGDHAGSRVSGAGDVNGDGLDDVIIGARDASQGDLLGTGESYVVFGKADGAPIDLSLLKKVGGGFRIAGINEQDFSGTSVSGTGDVNGDGLSDVIVGADFADPSGKTQAGQSYVVFGKADANDVLLADIVAGLGGFAIDGADLGDTSGHSVSGAGDVNGDGLADVVIGAPSAEPGGFQFEGESYVVFGKADGATVQLAEVIAGKGGFVIIGIDPLDASGEAVAGAGDVNGDGLADVIIGTPEADPGLRTSAGESYVVFGKADGTPVHLSDVVRGTGGFVINGIDPLDRSGAEVAGAGDVNGDGLSDVIIGASKAAPGGRTGAGESYVVFGKAGGAPVELADVAGGIGGFVLNGIDPNDESGCAVWGAADVNRDGLADVIIGARSADPEGWLGAGESYVVFGKADGTPVELSQVAGGAGGFVINGDISTTHSGESVSGAGDVNGDGLVDVIVGDPSGFQEGQPAFSGQSFVVLNPVLSGDLDGDGLADMADLRMLIGAWGPCPAACPPYCTGDLDGDCGVGMTDLLLLLADWSF